MTGERTVQILRPDSTYVGKQGLTYALGVTSQTAGTRGICLTAGTMPPGARAKAHLHDGIDTVGYIVAGEAMILYSAGAITCRAGRGIFLHPRRGAARTLQPQCRALHLRGCPLGRRRSGGHRHAP